MPPLITLRETWSHMSAVSGFDPLFAGIARLTGARGLDVVVPEDEVPVVRGFRQRVLRQLGVPCPADPVPTTGVTNPFPQRRHELAGVEILKLADLHPDLCILLAAAENHYGKVLSQAGPGIRERLFLCFHQPPSWLRLHWQTPEALQGLGGIVCLGGEQERYFQGICDSPTIRIRHGVVLDFFTLGPPPASKPPDRLLFVGQWLRDFETLARAMPVVWEKRPDVILDCVVPRHARHSPDLLKLARDPRVHWHAGISPEALRDLYQRASLLFLPLLDAVANNAVIEALACGVPIVTSNVGGIAEYLPQGAGILCKPGSPEGHALAALELLDCQEKRRAAARICRSFAETHLNWNLIASNLYRSIQDRMQCL